MFAALLCPRPGALSDDVWRLTTSVDRVAYIRSAGGVCGRSAVGWYMAQHIGWSGPARLGRPGSRLPLRASVRCRPGRGILWRPPAQLLWAVIWVGGSVARQRREGGLEVRGGISRSSGFNVGPGVPGHAPVTTRLTNRLSGMLHDHRCESYQRHSMLICWSSGVYCFSLFYSYVLHIHQFVL